MAAAVVSSSETKASDEKASRPGGHFYAYLVLVRFSLCPFFAFAVFKKRLVHKTIITDDKEPATTTTKKKDPMRKTPEMKGKRKGENTVRWNKGRVEKNTTQYWTLFGVSRIYNS